MPGIQSPPVRPATGAWALTMPSDPSEASLASGALAASPASECLPSRDRKGVGLAWAASEVSPALAASPAWEPSVAQEESGRPNPKTAQSPPEGQGVASAMDLAGLA